MNTSTNQNGSIHQNPLKDRESGPFLLCLQASSSFYFALNYHSTTMVDGSIENKVSLIDICNVKNVSFTPFLSFILGL